MTFFKDVLKTKDERKLTFDGLEDELEHRSAPVKTMLPMFRLAGSATSPIRISACGMTKT